MQTINKIFINGAFVTPHGTTQQELENPATGETITRVTLADEIDTQRAIDAANAAFKIYSQSSLQTRREYLQRIHDVMATSVGCSKRLQNFKKHRSKVLPLLYC